MNISSDDDPPVGYKNPPKGHQFSASNQPRIRRGKKLRTKRQIAEAALDRMLVLKETRMTVREAVLHRLAHLKRTARARDALKISNFLDELSPPAETGEKTVLKCVFVEPFGRVKPEICALATDSHGSSAS